MTCAAMFSGQGAQTVGMGQDLADARRACRELFSRANDALGYDLAGICFNGPEEELTKTNNCQPGIFVTSVACYTALCEVRPDISPVAVAGLSLGEWTALHIAGVLTFEDALRALAARGRFMQEACEEADGGMVSILGLGLDELEPICAAADVEIANINSPQQIVLSGAREGVVKAETLAKEAGAKRAIMLNVAGAYHSRLMATAAARLKETLADIPFATPAIPVIANVDGQPHGGPDEIRARMIEQITSPVQWVKTMEYFQGAGITSYVECGPGKVLSGLVKRFNRDADAFNVEDEASLAAATED